jgi:aminopeptidase-like protein
MITEPRVITDKQKELQEMERLFDRLFPICRSITGPGLRETLEILQEYVPLTVFGTPTGTKAFDWTIPPEWHIREAWIKGPDGKKIVDFADNNLHVINYSEPVDKQLSYGELVPHLHTLPHLPEAIPYVISYYKRRWGFCLPHRVYEQLPQEGTYHVYIDAKFVDGELNTAHAILPGETEEEVLISSYVCHPSLANNELSGPITAAFLYNRLAQWPKRRFTYRFAFVPETIGSITYLYRFGRELKQRLHAGLVLTCVGGKGPNGEAPPLSYKQSRQENAPIDEIVAHLFGKQAVEGVIRPFTPLFGSDERQYCSPGFNLPVGQMARAVYGTYAEYHNSLDTKEFMTIEALQRSVDEIEQVLRALELDGYYVNRKPYGEVKLDQHNLYPDMNGPSAWGRSNNNTIDGRTLLNYVLMVLNYSDGKHRLSEIADKYGCTIFDLEPVIEVLREKGLLVGPYMTEQELEEPLWME